MFSQPLKTIYTYLRCKNGLITNEVCETISIYFEEFSTVCDLPCISSLYTAEAIRSIENAFLSSSQSLLIYLLVGHTFFLLGHIFFTRYSSNIVLCGDLPLEPKSLGRSQFLFYCEISDTEYLSHSLCAYSCVNPQINHSWESLYNRCGDIEASNIFL